MSDLNMEAIDEQFIVIGTENYELEIDLMGGPTKAEVGGLPEGFYYDWDRSAQKMYIKSDLVETLSTGFAWQVELSKGSNEFIGQIAYHVIPPGAIFYALGLLHLYRDVPINFDIIIDNLPPVLIPFIELIGIKQESREYGINFSGEIPSSARFAENTGNLVFAVLDAEGAVIDSHDYPYEIESGAPPQIQAPVFSPKGGYGTLEFSDVRHAIAYDWQLKGVDTTWNTFDGTREIIDPGSVEVTPGQLSATVRFRHVQGAARYQYSLVSESHIVEWTYFDGTLQNGFITTIIPNLQDGVQYTLRLRVGAPWIGTPIEVTVFGGRLCYALQVNTSDRDNQWLYMFHTGHLNGTRAGRVKRMLLPTAMTRIRTGGLAVSPDGDVFVMQDNVPGTKQIYMFESGTIDAAADGSRLTQDRIFSGVTAGTYYGLAVYGGELYLLRVISTFNTIRIIITDIPNSSTSLTTRTTGGNVAWVTGGTVAFGLSVNRDNIWSLSTQSLILTDRGNLTLSDSRIRLYQPNGIGLDPVSEKGLKVINNDFYVIHSGGLYIYRINPQVHATRLIRDFELSLPSGLTDPYYLDVRT